MFNLREKEVCIEIFNLASELKAKIDNACQKNGAFKSQALNKVPLCMSPSFWGLDVANRNLPPFSFLHYACTVFNN